MPFSEAVWIALASLRANKLRSFLTILGILIGVASVVAVVAITDGLDAYMSDKVLELGTKSFTIQKFPDVITSRQEFLDAQKRKDLNEGDMEAVRRACDACLAVGGRLQVTRDVKWGRTLQENVEISGLTENATRIGAVRDIVEGRPLSTDDIDRARSVAVIGWDLVEAFFGQVDPLGKAISLGDHEVKVIGVGEKKGSVFGNSQDNFVWIPFTTFQKFYGGRETVDIPVEAKSMALLETAEDQARM